MSQVQFDENSTEGENQGAINDIRNVDTGESAIFGIDCRRDPDAAAIEKFLKGEMACI